MNEEPRLIVGLLGFVIVKLPEEEQYHLLAVLGTAKVSVRVTVTTEPLESPCGLK